MIGPASPASTQGGLGQVSQRERERETEASHFGFLRTRITESPRRNSLLMKRSLFTGLAFFLPPCGTSVHISRTFSSTMFEWRSKALTRARIFRLLRQLISTWELSFTHFCSTDKGPTSKLSFSSGLASSAMVVRWLAEQTSNGGTLEEAEAVPLSQ